MLHVLRDKGHIRTHTLSLSLFLYPDVPLAIKVLDQACVDVRRDTSPQRYGL
jgi:hypothetical protein